MIILFSTGLNAQESHFNLSVGFGPSYFFNDPSLSRYIDHTLQTGVNYLLKNKSGNIIFNPGFYLQRNAYHSGLKDKKLAHATQRTLTLGIDMLIKISKKSLLRAGLFMNSVYHTRLYISDTQYNGRGYFGFSNPAVQAGYDPSTLQAGFTAGITFYFNLFNRENTFDIKMCRHASQLVNSDYILNKYFAGAEKTVLSVKARPTMLIFCFAFNLQKIKKDKKKEEED